MTSLADVIVTDESDLPGNPETARKALAEAVTASTSDAPAPAPVSTNTDYVLPDKFKGKSIKDVVEAYQNLESRYGTMANDLGVQRQLTDRLLDLKRSDDLKKYTPPAAREVPKVTSAELLDRPQETLERVIDARTGQATDDVNARMARLENGLAQQSFISRHSDYQSVTSDPKFTAWVNASPLRLRAAAAAHQGNWQIADELLTEFKASNPAPASAPSVETPAADPTAEGVEAARRAALSQSGSAGSANTDGKSRGGEKLYRRTDLMRLRITDPEAYYDQDFQDEILLAHHEGRVR